MRARIAMVVLLGLSLGLHSGCASIGHGLVGVDDPPYEGTKLNLMVLGTMFSGDELPESEVGSCVVSIVDLPFSFVADTIRLPFDLIEMSRYPKYRGRVIHGETGEAMGGVIVMAAITPITNESSSTSNAWRQQQRWLRAVGLNAKIHHCIDRRDYACVATRTNRRGEFIFQLNTNNKHPKGFVAFEEGFEDAWRPLHRTAVPEGSDYVMHRPLRLVPKTDGVTED